MFLFDGMMKLMIACLTQHMLQGTVLNWMNDAFQNSWAFMN